MDKKKPAAFFSGGRFHAVLRVVCLLPEDAHSAVFAVFTSTTCCPS